MDCSHFVIWPSQRCIVKIRLHVKYKKISAAQLPLVRNTQQLHLVRTVSFLCLNSTDLLYIHLFYNNALFL